MTVPTVAEAPYAVFKPHGDPKYFKTFLAARKAILNDLGSLQYTWRRLDVDDSIAATAALEQQARQLSSSGGTVEGVCDPHTRMRYRADLVKRAEL